jgi:hypothetical protein
VILIIIIIIISSSSSMGTWIVLDSNNGGGLEKQGMENVHLYCIKLMLIKNPLISGCKLEN